MAEPGLARTEGVAVEAIGLTKVYPGRGRDRRKAAAPAVDGVSFEVRTGAALAVIGESGSGKTTLARMLAGLVPPTSGQLQVLGQQRTARMSRHSREAWGRRVQMVFQNPYASLDPRQSIAAAIGEVIHLHEPALSRAQRRARSDELLSRVGLDTRVGRALPAHLSGGQRQRAAIARSLAAAPEVLLLDEPVSALDVSVQAQILNLIADIRDESGITTIFISHDLSVVRQVCDEAIVMLRGAIVERGPTTQIIDAPEHPYTRALRASVPRPRWRREPM